MSGRRVLEVVIAGDSVAGEAALSRTADALDKVGTASERAAERSGKAAEKQAEGSGLAASAVEGLSKAAAASGQDLGAIPDVLDQVGGAMDAASQETTKAGKVMAGVGAIAGGLAAVVTAIADKEKAAINELKVAVDNAGQSFDAWEARLKGVASSQAQFGHDTAEVASALATLTDASQDPEQAIKDLTIVMDLAAKKNLDLATAAQQVANVYTGNLNVLRSVGINTNDVVDSQKELDKANKEVATSSKHLHTVQEQLGNLEAQIAEARKRAAEQHAQRVQAAADKEASAQQHLADVEASIAQRHKDAVEAADGAVASSADKLGSAKKRLADIEDKLHEKTQLSLKDQFSLRDAQDALYAVQERIADGQLSGAEAAQALRDANLKVSDTQALQAEKSRTTAADTRDLKAAQDDVTKAADEHTQALGRQRTAGEQTTQDARQLRDALAQVRKAHEDLAKARAADDGGPTMAMLQQETRLRREVREATGAQQTAQAHLKHAQQDALEHGTKVQAALKALQDRVKGSAEADANTLHGYLRHVGADVENFIGEHSDGLQKITVGVALAASTLGPIYAGIKAAQAAMIAGQAAVALSATETAAVTTAAATTTIVAEEGVAAASTAAGAATGIALGPIILVLAAIGIAAYLLWKNWDTVWHGIKVGAAAAWDFLKAGWDFLSNTVFLPWKLELHALEWVFEKVWHGIKSVWGGAGDFFKSVFSGIGDVVLAPMRLVITVINDIIDTLNSIHFDFHAPKWAGGFGWSFDGFGIPNLPTFAVGGIVDNVPTGDPTLAIVHGGEGVFNAAQLRALGGMVRGGSGGAGGGQVIRITIDARGALIPDAQSLEKLGRMVADGVLAALLQKQSAGTDLQIKDTRLVGTRS